MSSPETSALPRVLLIDDDAISREVLAMMLEMHGFPVDSAEDGVQALEFLGRASVSTAAGATPDVILMDAQMPGLSGAGLIEALRKASRARIVAISGSDVNDYVRHAADGFLLKPVEPDALKNLLQPGNIAKNSKPPAQDDDSQLAADDTDEALIDPAVLGKLKAMMSAASVREIYTATATDLESRLVTLAAAMADGRASEVARVAHAIKGGCAMVGLSIAKDAADRLETSNLPDMWQKELAQLHFALDKLQCILSDRLPW